MRMPAVPMIVMMTIFCSMTMSAIAQGPLYGQATNDLAAANSRWSTMDSRRATLQSKLDNMEAAVYAANVQADIDKFEDAADAVESGDDGHQDANNAIADAQAAYDNSDWSECITECSLAQAYMDLADSDFDDADDDIEDLWPTYGNWT